MTFRFFLAAVLIASAVAGPVAAQDGAVNSTTAATTSEPDGSAAENVSVELGPTAEITSWRFEAGTWYVTVRAEVPVQVTLTDAAAMHRALSEGSGAGASTIPYRGYTVDSGETTIEMAGETRDGQGALSVAANGQLVVLRTGSISASRPAVPWSTVQMLVLGTAAAVGGLGVLLVRRRHEDEDLDYQRAT